MSARRIRLLTPAVLGWVLLFFGVFGAHAAERFEVTVSGTQDAGARPMLLIPGLASSGAVWDETAARYGDRFQVHTFTFAGFAGVPPADGPVIDGMVDALAAYLNDKDLEGAVLIGHSLGGFTAMAVALEAPDRVAQVVVVDSLPFLGQLFLGAADAQAAEPGAAMMRDGLRDLDDETFRARQTFNTQTVQVTAPEDQERVLSWVLASDRDTMSKALYELLTADLRRDLTEMKAQGLVLYAWIPNPMMTQAQMDTLYKTQYAAWNRVILKRIDDSKHFIMLDQPDTFFGALDAFLRP